MAFVHFEFFPIPSPEVLAHCPSEAAHERSPTMNPQPPTIPSRKLLNCFPCEASHERQLISQKEIPHIASGRPQDECPAPKVLAQGSLSPTMNSCEPPAQDLDRDYSLLSAPGPHITGMTGRTESVKPAAKFTPVRRAPRIEISEEAEQTIRIMEWSKGMVMRATKRAVMAERQTLRQDRFKLLLSKWRSQAQARAQEEDEGEHFVEKQQEKASEVVWPGKFWPTSSALRRRDNESRQGLALVLTSSKQGDRDKTGFSRFSWTKVFVVGQKKNYLG